MINTTFSLAHHMTLNTGTGTRCSLGDACRDKG